MLTNIILSLLFTLYFSSLIQILSATTAQKEYKSNQGIMINNMSKPDINVVKRGVLYASVARCSDKKVKEWNCKNCLLVPETTFMSIFSNKLLHTKGYIAIDNELKSINLVFRGSNNPMNDIKDFIFVQAWYGVVPAAGAGVHLGFLNSMRSLQNQFLPTIKHLLSIPAYKDYKIYAIGHSLGGAVASLSILQIQNELQLEWNRFTLLTYGQPRTGNKRFAIYYNTLDISAARVVNYNDLVPHLPNSFILSYAHHGNELWIPGKENERPKYCDNQIFIDPECSHSVPNYKLSYNAHNIYFNVSMEEKLAC